MNEFNQSDYTVLPAGGRTLICTVFLSIFFFINASDAQCPFTCNDGVQASLNEHCENEITWDALLEGSPAASCIPDLQVEVFGPNGMLLPTSPFVTGDDIDQVLFGRVTHLPSGQSCQTTILVEDKLAPKIFCIDTLLSCFHDTTPVVVGIPEYYDNCTFDVKVSYFDQNTTYNCNYTDTILLVNRRWEAVDSSGNVAVCWQKIYVERPSIDSIDFPVSLDDISAPPLSCTSGQTDPQYTGVPLYKGLNIDSICAFLAEYNDVTVPICDGSYTIFRKWTVYDGCDDTLRVEEQTINVMDTLPPILTCPDNFSVTVANNECKASVYVPVPFTADSCSTDIAISLEGSFGLISGNHIPDLQMGVYPTTCHATDACGNVSSCQFEITVIDSAPPVAVGISSPVVSLLPSGTTYLPAATFDGGSWDNCDEISLTARRMDASGCPGDDGTEFGPEVPFFCCDAGQMVEIELRVMDDSGNASMVPTLVQVKDNIEPVINCPDDITINCTDDYTDLNLTGQPSVDENCSGFVLTSADSVELNACGEGFVKRHWLVTDISDETALCIQTITVEDLSPFHINTTNSNDPNDDVIWPENYISTTCGDGLDPVDLPTEFAYPQILTNSPCQMVAISYSDTWLSQPNNACIEILRNWTVVDWCQFNQATFEGSWQYGQVLRIQNSDSPTLLSDCTFEEFCSYDTDCSLGAVTLHLDAEDDCNDLFELEFSYEIDYFDDGSSNLTGSGQTAEADLPIGMHRIYWEVVDGCYNATKCDYLFSVVDCKEPTPVCDQTIVEIIDDIDPVARVFANEFNAGSYDNCTDDESLVYSFSTDQADTTLTFSCDQVGINQIEVWVTDEMGNQDFCVTEVVVQDNNLLCSNALVVSGEVKNQVGDPVSNVMVSLNNTATIDSMITGIDGTFMFNNVPPGEDYTISPYKNTNPLNGVTTYDLVLISRHILGVLPLNSPYKIIAADANKSNTVTTFDLVQIRKLILYIDTEFPSNNSWRFIEKDYQFDDPLKPLEDDFPEVTNINNLSADIMANFTAVKIGDVNNSADTTE